MSNKLQWGLMDATSPTIKEFVYRHDFILVILAAIVLLIGAIKLYILLEERSSTPGGILGGVFGERPSPPE